MSLESKIGCQIIPRKGERSDVILGGFEGTILMFLMPCRMGCEASLLSLCSSCFLTDSFLVNGNSKERDDGLARSTAGPFRELRSAADCRKACVWERNGGTAAVCSPASHLTHSRFVKEGKAKQKNDMGTAHEEAIDSSKRGKAFGIVERDACCSHSSFVKESLAAARLLTSF